MIILPLILLTILLIVIIVYTTGEFGSGSDETHPEHHPGDSGGNPHEQWTRRGDKTLPGRWPRGEEGTFSGRSLWEPEEPQRCAGRHGEQAATHLIRKVLREEDHLFTNVSIVYEGRSAELDNVIVNKYGVFVIEVKNYKGTLFGSEEDYEWKKQKDDGYGNVFVAPVKNPIRQVKRQVYILAKYLEYYHVWVEGYVIFIRGESPVKSAPVLENLGDIDRVIHTFRKNHLSSKAVNSISQLLGEPL